MNDVQEQQYDVIEKRYNNLRSNYDRAVDSILGVDYANYCGDIYSSDDMTCDDMICEYLRVEHERDSWKKTTIIFGIAFACMSLVVLFLGVH